MKILVIQLARFGDIYQTWPSLLALHEKEDCEVHLLVRERFVDATMGLPDSIHVHVVRTGTIIAPFLAGSEALDSDGLDDLLSALAVQAFDKVINLSYSPFSSYLTSYLEMSGSSSRGYTRHGDGFLNMKDDASAFFYAQAGVDRSSRIHLTQIFAMTCEVDLQEHHLHPKIEIPSKIEIPKESYYILHVGASDLGKTLSEQQISDLVRGFLDTQKESLVLIGVQSEQRLGDFAKPREGSERIYDFIGQTKLTDVFHLLQSADGLIGGDSAPIHMASLLNRPVLNFKNEFINSFETGPFSHRFFVWDLKADSTIAKDRLAGALSALRISDSQTLPKTSERADQEWQLIQALYTGGPYPNTVSKTTPEFLAELVELLPRVYKAAQNPQEPAHAEALRQFDLRLEEIEKCDSLVGILIRWFNTERLRIEPGEFEKIQRDTLEAFDKFYLILSDWIRVLAEEGIEFIKDLQDEAERLDQLVKNFRFINLNAALLGIENLLPDLWRSCSTEVQRATLVEAKANIEKALEASDFECVADILEYRVKPIVKDVII